MADIRTVTLREIEQITNATCDKPKVITWHGKRIHINPLLSFKEVFELVDSVMSECVNPDDQIIILESVDFVLKSKLLEKYTGIILSGDLDTQYRVVYGSDIIDTVFSNVNQAQLSNLKNVLSAYTGMNL